MASKRIVVASLGVFGIAGLVYADSTVEFFTDPALFDAALQQAGKVSKGKWDFAATNSQGPGADIAFPDPLDIKNPGPFDSVPLDNVRIQSNVNPQGQGGPNPGSGLRLFNAPIFGLDNTAVVISANFALLF